MQNKPQILQLLLMVLPSYVLDTNVYAFRKIADQVLGKDSLPAQYVVDDKCCGDNYSEAMKNAVYFQRLVRVWCACLLNFNLLTHSLLISLRDDQVRTFLQQAPMPEGENMAQLVQLMRACAAAPGEEETDGEDDPDGKADADGEGDADADGGDDADSKADTDGGDDADGKADADADGGDDADADGGGDDAWWDGDDDPPNPR